VFARFHETKSWIPIRESGLIRCTRRRRFSRLRRSGDSDRLRIYSEPKECGHRRRSARRGVTARIVFCNTSRAESQTVMKAWSLPRPASVDERPLVLAERPTPIAREDELLVRVLACGICRTDLHVVEGELPVRLPSVIPGHQIVG